MAKGPQSRRRRKGVMRTPEAASARQGFSESVVIDGQRSLTIAGAQTVTVGATHRETVGGSQTIQVGADQQVTIGGSQTIAIGKSRTVRIGSDDRLEVGKDVTILVRGKVLVRADNEIRLETGDASLVLKPNGDIQLRGTRITIEGSADVHLKGSKVHTN
jgi:type VI secretion system secreted protein VgrG